VGCVPKFSRERQTPKPNFKIIKTRQTLWTHPNPDGSSKFGVDIKNFLDISTDIPHR